jgi:hypothetical protein
MARSILLEISTLVNPRKELHVSGFIEQFGLKKGVSMSPEFEMIFTKSLDTNKWSSKLDWIQKLESGWNGYSSPAPSRTAVVTARRFLASLLAKAYEPYRIAPSAEGGVGITHKRKNRRVYVEFFNDGEVFALFSDGESEPRSERVNQDADQFRDLIAKIREYLDA